MLQHLHSVLIQNDSINALGVFGSVESGTTWPRSDTDLLLLTNDTFDRREVIYDKVKGQLVHYQVLSIPAWNLIIADCGSPMFAPLAETRILFDKNGDLQRGIAAAQAFSKDTRDIWMCRELTACIAYLHYSEKYLYLGCQRDAKTQLLLALGSLAMMELYAMNIYPPREVWAHPYIDQTHAAKLMLLFEANDLTGATQAAWCYVRKHLATVLAPLLKYVQTHGPVSFFHLLQAPELKRMTISERLVQEMLEHHLIYEKQSLYPSLGISEVKYTVNK